MGVFFEAFRSLFTSKPVEVAKPISKRVEIGAEFTTWYGICPDCGGNEWYEGPSGGMCQNIKCANDMCGCKLNTCFAGAQRIANDPITPKTGIVTAYEEAKF